MKDSHIEPITITMSKSEWILIHGLAQLQMMRSVELTAEGKDTVDLFCNLVAGDIETRKEHAKKVHLKWDESE